MIGLTHAVFGWLLAVFFSLNPAVVMLGALFPDAELILDTPHRGPLHSILLMLPLCALSYFFLKDYGLSFSVGVFSHLFLDSFTAQGLPVFYPLFNDFFSLHFYNSDTLNWLVIILSVVLIVNRDKFSKRDLGLKHLLLLFMSWFFVLVTFKFFFQ